MRVLTMAFPFADPPGGQAGPRPKAPARSGGTLRVLLLSLIAALAVPGSARAGMGDAKTSRIAYPAREVERPPLLPRGWYELTFAYEQHLGWGAWTSDGKRDPFEHAKWSTYSETATFRFGISRRAELWWEVSFEQARLDSDAWPQDSALTDWSLGDPRFGWRIALLQAEAPQATVALDLWYKGPAGEESGGTYIGGPLNVSAITFTTGTPDAYVGALAKKQFGPIALTAHLGYMRRFSGVVQYLVETSELQFAGRIKPGDQIRADAGAMVQLGPIWIGAAPYFTYRMATKVGTTSPGVSPARRLKAVADSSGYALDVRGDLGIKLMRGLDVNGWFVYPLMGQDLQFFPLEELQPTMGPTFGGAAEVRF